VITGRALNPVTGERPAFLATPASGDRRDDDETGRLDDTGTPGLRTVTQMNR
jgi:hypothetical protein